MRKIVKSLSWVVIPVAILAFSLSIVRTRHAVGVLTKTAIRRAERDLGVNIRVGKTDIHLLGGKLTLSDVRIANPEGFEEGDLFSLKTALFRMRILPLLRGRADMTHLSIHDARLTVTRNEQNQVNVAELGKTGKTTSGDAGGPTSEAADPTSADRTPPPESEKQRDPHDLIIRDLSCSSTLSYIDYGKTNDPFRISFAVVAEGQNLSSIDLPGDTWGHFSITSHLEEDPEAFVTTLAGRLAPWKDTHRPSFDLQGDIRSIRFRDLGPEAENWEIQCESANLKIDITCRDGQYTENSKLTVTLEKPTVTGDLAKKARNIPVPAELTIPIPLRGTFRNPQMDFQSAAIQAVLQHLAGSLGALLESTTVDGKQPDGDLGNAARNLGNLLKNWQGK